MALFMVDEHGRKVLATRKRRGDGCHGKKNLWWKSHGDGTQALCCRVCGSVLAERVLCFRCGGAKAERPCRVCEAGKDAAKAALGAAPGPLPPSIDDDPELACDGGDGLCCRHAGIPEKEEAEPEPRLRRMVRRRR